MSAYKPKKCKVCGETYTPVRPLQKVCSLTCALIQSNALRLKREAKEHREAKRKAKTRAEWMKEAQAAFNRYIRLRDATAPCISCGRHHQGQYHAGHYRTTKAAPELRFDELNVWKQCSSCNTHLSGNLIAYRASLIARIGLDKVEWLEGKHEPKKYTIDDLMIIKATYTRKAKELEREQESMRQAA